MNDEITHIAPETRTGTHRGIRLLLRAYLDTEGRKRVIWQVGENKGKNGVLDIRESDLIFPNDQKVSIDGQSMEVFGLPRWLTQVLQKDFEEFPDELVHENSESIQGDGDDTGDEEIQPMFDDITVANKDGSSE